MIEQALAQAQRSGQVARRRSIRRCDALFPPRAQIARASEHEAIEAPRLEAAGHVVGLFAPTGPRALKNMHVAEVPKQLCPAPMSEPAVISALFCALPRPHDT